MQGRDIICIGASVGGIQALGTIASGLPTGLAATIFVVQHIHPAGPGFLPAILRNAGALPARHPTDGEAFEPGHILVAPPDHHILVASGGRVHLSRGPRENRARPAIDVLFRSAALAFGPRVVGIVLTGYLDDGTVGLRAIKLCGGTSVVQNPTDADAPEMPRNALANASVDHVVRLRDIAPLITRLAREPVTMKTQATIMPKELEIETAIAAGDTTVLAGVKSFGEPPLFTCPECHGRPRRAAR
jgi:two-component system chemotaxis response regulator CheB